MPVYTIPTCDQIVSCGPPSDWDLMFCICPQSLETAGVCTSAVDHFTNVNGDKTANIVGQYATSGTTASLLSATPAPDIAYGQGSPGWSNTSGILDSDSTAFASASVTQNGGQISGQSLQNWPTDYLTVSNFGFQIPTTATIVAILYGFSAPQIIYSSSHSLADGSAYLWNIVTTCQGNNYYWRDPNSSSVNAHGLGGLGTSPSAPWPDNGYYLNGVVQNPSAVNIAATSAYYAFGQPGFSNVTSPVSGGIGKGRALNVLSTYGGSFSPQLKSPLGQGIFTPRAYGNGASPSTSSTLMDGLPQGWMGLDNWSGCNAFSGTLVSGLIYGEAAYYLGPLAKGGFPMTPTKTTWTPAEINDPTFGVGVSQASVFVRAYDGALSPQIIPLAMGGISVAVYYVGGIVGNPFANCNGVEFR